jgi:hypothetical protein
MVFKKFSDSLNGTNECAAVTVLLQANNGYWGHNCCKTKSKEGR